jgi:hypothetical protein
MQARAEIPADAIRWTAIIPWKTGLLSEPDRLLDLACSGVTVGMHATLMLAGCGEDEQCPTPNAFVSARAAVKSVG